MGREPDVARVRPRLGLVRRFVLRSPSSVLTQMLYQRIGPFAAARRGLLIVGGRRPWRAVKLQSCFEPA